VSMENPEGEQGALVLGAVEIAGEEGDHILHPITRNSGACRGPRFHFVRGNTGMCWGPRLLCCTIVVGSGDGLRGHGRFLSGYSSFVRIRLLFAAVGVLSSHSPRQAGISAGDSDAAITPQGIVVD
jgi:hypothetical protein